MRLRTLRSSYVRLRVRLAVVGFAFAATGDSTLVTEELSTSPLLLRLRLVVKKASSSSQSMLTSIGRKSSALSSSWAGGGSRSSPAAPTAACCEGSFPICGSLMAAMSVPSRERKWSNASERERETPRRRSFLSEREKGTNHLHNRDDSEPTWPGGMCGTRVA